jgi:hypothetical protein
MCSLTSRPLQSILTPPDRAYLLVVSVTGPSYVSYRAQFTIYSLNPPPNFTLWHFINHFELEQYRIRRGSIVYLYIPLIIKSRPIPDTDIISLSVKWPYLVSSQQTSDLFGTHFKQLKIIRQTKPANRPGQFYEGFIKQ